MSRSATRFTSQPDSPAPELHCPDCGRPLMYHDSVFGGVDAPERWDYFDCRTCGRFQYRHRTQRLRAYRE